MLGRNGDGALKSAVSWTANVRTDGRWAASTCAALTVAEGLSSSAADGVIDALLAGICATDTCWVSGTTAICSARILVGNDATAVRRRLELRVWRSLGLAAKVGTVQSNTNRDWNDSIATALGLRPAHAVAIDETEIAADVILNGGTSGDGRKSYIR